MNPQEFLDELTKQIGEKLDGKTEEYCNQRCEKWREINFKSRLDQIVLNQVKFQILSIFQGRENIIFKPLMIEKIDDIQLYKAKASSNNVHMRIQVRKKLGQLEYSIDWITN